MASSPHQSLQDLNWPVKIHAIAHLCALSSLRLQDMLRHDDQARQQQRRQHTLERRVLHTRQQLRQLLQRTAGTQPNNDEDVLNARLPRPKSCMINLQRRWLHNAPRV